MNGSMNDQWSNSHSFLTVIGGQTLDQQSVVQHSIDRPSPYVGDDNLYNLDSMSQGEPLIAATETIVIKTISWSSAADYNVEKAFNNKGSNDENIGFGNMRDRQRQATRCCTLLKNLKFLGSVLHDLPSSEAL